MSGYTKGDIIFIKNNGWFFEKIRQVIKCEYDHVAIMTCSEDLIEATPTGGVQYSHISKYTNRSFVVKRLKRQEYTSKMVQYVQQQVGKRYDIWQAISLYFLLLIKAPKSIEPVDIKNAFICSELVVNACEFSGLRFFKECKPYDDRITPADIFNSEELVSI